jgi:TPR repeat protein
VAERDGSAEAQLRLGRLYERGEGVLQSFVEAVSWFRGAAEQGAVPAMARLGEIYLTGMAAPNTATPAALLRMRESSGQDSLLKRLYPEGLAVHQDTEQAAHWNLRAAQAGDSAAQARLGHQYARGLGVALDLNEAERWFAAAADQDSSGGLLGLGMLYAGGYGGRREHLRAQEWLERCAERDNSTAQLCLAVLLLFGEGVPHDAGARRRPAQASR